MAVTMVVGALPYPLGDGLSKGLEAGGGGRKLVGRPEVTDGAEP